MPIVPVVSTLNVVSAFTQRTGMFQAAIIHDVIRDSFFGATGKAYDLARMPEFAKQFRAYPDELIAASVCAVSTSSNLGCVFVFIIYIDITGVICSATMADWEFCQGEFCGAQFWFHV
jgi:hypothetical protein